MKNLVFLTVAVLVAAGSIAQARPFSTAEEMTYLKTTLSQIVQAEGYQLDEGSLTLEPDHLKGLANNYSPFRLIYGVDDDRNYTVNFRLKNAVGIHAGQVYFMTATAPYCLIANNTTFRGRSTLTGKENCMALSATSKSEDLGRIVTAASLLAK